MTISSISQATQEGQVTFLSSFKRNGKVYFVWTTALGSIYQSIWWKPHDGANATEIPGGVTALFRNIAAIYNASDDTVVVAYDDAADPTAFSESTLFVVRFAATTGAVVSPPLQIGRGMRASLLYRGGIEGSTFELVYTSRKQKAAYVRESLDGGVSWSGERPVLSNYVRETVDIVAVPFSDEFISIAQLGADARPMTEVATYTRTRPLTSIVQHPTVPSQAFVAEPSWLDATYFSDYLRGALRLSRDQTKLYWIDGVRLGTSDSLNEVILANISRTSISTQTSVHNGNVDVGLGDNLTSFTVSPFAAGPAVDCFGSGPIAIDFDVSDSYAYVAGTKEVAPTTNGGGFDIVRLSDMTRAEVMAPSSTVLGRAVAVGMVPGGPHCIFFAVVESGTEKLRIYVENGMSPSMAASHKMPARVNKLHAVMESASEGYVYVSMVDRLNVYHLNGLDRPIILVATIPILTKGSFFQAYPISNGNIVAAMGAGGVGVFTPDGGTLAELTLSGIHPEPWRPGAVRALNDLVIPTDKSLYSAQGKYFKCSTAGTSGAIEPIWAPLSYGNVADGSAVWQEVGLTDSIITGIAVDETQSRILAVGVVGGPKGTQGRIFTVKAPTLVPGLPRAATPLASHAAGTYTSPITVSLASATAGAAIYYTLDGSYPTAASLVYQTEEGMHYPIVFSTDGAITTLRAVSVLAEMADSDPLDVTYSINFPMAATPVISPAGPLLTGDISITCVTPGVSIYYTTDGSTPTAASTLYTGPFAGTFPATVKAVAVKLNTKTSAVASVSYGDVVANQEVSLDAAYYPGSGATWMDVSGNGRDATLTGSPTFDPANGGGLVFDGNGSQAFSCPSLISANPGFTIDWWWKPGRVANYNPQMGIAGWGTFVFHAGASGQFWCGTDVYTRFEGTNAGSVAVGVIHNFTYTWTYGSGGRIYKNGSLLNGPLTSQAAPQNLTTAFALIGDAKCTFYALRIHSKPLSAAEISANFTARRARFGI